MTKELSKLEQQIQKFMPFNEQEEHDKAILLKWFESGSDILTRENEIAHLTASAWVVSPDKKSVLMAYHNIYHSWARTGGHADGDQDLLHVALKEAREETGITNLKPVSEGIFSLEMLTVDGHVKRGEYVSSHLHANVTYLLEADETDTLHIKPDENSGVRWFALDEALKACSEPWMAEHIYKKLNEKLSLENPDTGRNR